MATDAGAPRAPAASKSSSKPQRVLVVGSGTRFLSGISVYTFRLANVLAERHRVTLITMRRLLPARLYPGSARVGAQLTHLQPAAGVSAYDGVDWYWLPSILRAAWLIVRRRPQVAIFQWWTGTVLHTYIALAVLVKLMGGKLVIEFHEVLDTAEAKIPIVHRYVRTFGPVLMRLADGFTVHSEFDRDLVGGTWPQTKHRPLAVLPHGPHDHYTNERSATPLREAPADACNLLFFGVIRPFKGLEHLVEAFEKIPDDLIGTYWLTVVGETWEGWTLPAEMIARSPRRDRITFVNRYVTDEELEGYLEGADAVVLPYLRSSLSGPLHVAMGYGLPIVMTEVGGNVEAAAGYAGIVLVPPSDPTALEAAIERLPELSKTRYEHPHSWSDTRVAYEELFARLRASSR